MLFYFFSISPIFLIHLSHYNSLIVFLEIFSSIVVKLTPKIKLKQILHHCAMKKNAQRFVLLFIRSCCILKLESLVKKNKKKYEERFKVCIHHLSHHFSCLTIYFLFDRKKEREREKFFYLHFFHLPFWLIMKKKIYV